MPARAAMSALTVRPVSARYRVHCRPRTSGGCGRPPTKRTIETRTLDDDWTVVTTDGSRAAHWEHTVAVTDDGVEILTRLPGDDNDL